MISLALAAAMMPQEPKVATIQLAEPQVVEQAVMLDVDLDGRSDLVLSNRNTESGERSVQVHRRQPKGPAFVPTPTRRLALDGSIVAFTFCDCDPRAGRELVLLTSTTAAVVLRQPDGSPDYKPLFRHALVWPAPSSSRALPLPRAARDLDGDGREDLLLPSPNGWSAWFQTEDGTFVEQSIELPRWRNRLRDAVGAGGRGGGFQLRIGSGTSTRNSGPLVATAARTPPCTVVDLDGDGRDDLAMQRNGALFVGAQQAARQLTLQQRDLPLPQNRLKLLDPSFDVQWPDVNGDGRPDLLLTTSAKRDDEVEARVDLFLTRTDGSWPERHSSRLRMQPMGQAPQLVDADGDGREDLCCVTIRTASMSNLTSGDKASLDAQLTVYHNDGEGFARPPKLNVALQLRGSRDLRQPFLRVRPGRKGFPGDVLLALGGRLERRLLNKRGDRLGMADADASADTEDDTRIEIADEHGDDVLMITGGEVRHVRFRR